MIDEELPFFSNKIDECDIEVKIMWNHQLK